MRDKYILRVQVGDNGDRSTWENINVNDETQGHPIENEYFKGQIKVRIRKYDGLPVDKTTKDTLNPDSDYFFDNKNLFSVEIKGKFKKRSDGKDWNANNIMFGNQFDKPLKLPPLVDVATKFATWFDPGLQMDLRADKPWAFSKMLVSFNKIHVTKGDDDVNLIQGEKVKEDTSIISNIKESKEDKAVSLRQRYFSKPENLSKVNIDETHTFHLDFFNPYLDFNLRGISIPFWTINVMDYWDNQDLSYYLKYKDENEEIVFLVFSFQLVDIQEAFEKI